VSMMRRALLACPWLEMTMLSAGGGGAGWRAEPSQARCEALPGFASAYDSTRRSLFAPEVPEWPSDGVLKRPGYNIFVLESRRAGRRWVINLQGVSEHSVVSEALEGVAGERRGRGGEGDAAGAGESGAGGGGGGGGGVDYRVTGEYRPDYSLSGSGNGAGRCKVLEECDACGKRVSSGGAAAGSDAENVAVTRVGGSVDVRDIVGLSAFGRARARAVQVDSFKTRVESAY